jgi:pre-rRNA-processing protein IPI3
MQQFLDDDYPAEELARDHAFFLQLSSTAAGSSTEAGLQSKVAQLEAEVGWLKEQLGKAKGVNDQMWESVVKRVLNSQDTGKGARNVTGEMDVEEEERSRKRSRS